VHIKTQMDEPLALICSRSRRIPAVLFDASEEAQRLREDAAREASGLVAAARAEADAVREAAAAAGREEGMARASELCARAGALRDEVFAAAEAELVELAFAIAARVLALAVERAPAAVVEVARRALEAARQRIEITVLAHPEDVAALRMAEPQLVEELERARRISIREHPAVGRGGVIVETEVGTIDGRLDSQLAALRRAVEGGCRERDPRRPAVSEVEPVISGVELPISKAAEPVAASGASRSTEGAEPVGALRVPAPRSDPARRRVGAEGRP
jgi:type III secretion protein L